MSDFRAGEAGAYLLVPLLILVGAQPLPLIGDGPFIGSVEVTALVSVACCVLALVVYRAHFSSGIPNALAWPCIALAGVLLIVFFANAHRSAGIICTADLCPNGETLTIEGTTVSVNRDFWTAIYFSVVTFTTLGYGDFQPHPELRFLAWIEAISGYVFLGLLVGTGIDVAQRAGRS